MKTGGQVHSNCLSEGEARWSGPPRTASVPDSSATLSAGAPRQLRYTVSWSVVTLLLPILLAGPAFVGELGGEVEGSRLEAWMKSHKSEVAIT